MAVSGAAAAAAAAAVESDMWKLVAGAREIDGRGEKEQIFRFHHWGLQAALILYSLLSFLSFLSVGEAGDI